MNTTKNILFVTHRDEIIGGGEISLFELIKHLDREKFQPFLLMAGGLDMLRLAKEAGVTPKLMKFPRLRLIFFLKVILTLLRLAFFVHKKKITILHANTSRAMFYCGIVAKLLGRRIVWHVRITNKDPWLDTVLYYFADLVICNSKATSCRFTGYKNQRIIKVIYNGMDPARYSHIAKREIFKDIPQDHKIVLNIARLEPMKGQEFFIELAKKVKEKKKNVKFIIVGEDKSPQKKYFKKLEKMTEDLNLRKCVVFMGQRSDVPNILGEGDILVSTSKIESFGRVLMEAAACQKPVLAFKTGGMVEVVDGGKTGFLVEEGDIQSMAEKVLLLLSDEKLASEMGICGRQRVLSKFTSSLHARKIEKIYDDIETRKK